MHTGLTGLVNGPPQHLKKPTESRNLIVDTSGKLTHQVWYIAGPWFIYTDMHFRLWHISRV